MTTATPLARYGAVEGALASGFATAELHHSAGHDPHTQAEFFRELTGDAIQFALRQDRQVGRPHEALEQATPREAKYFPSTWIPCLPAVWPSP
ncbi:MAG: hypothetical protein EOS37_02345 [Mesorhizobium sp.]|nr:MAG: hypothetical protein EOS37_02345 [Mesorhizobium sp.]